LNFYRLFNEAIENFTIAKVASRQAGARGRWGAPAGLVECRFVSPDERIKMSERVAGERASWQPSKGSGNRWRAVAVAQQLR